ncbi:MAG: SIS domain-containing protein [Oscillospiraceae bacterium]
MVKFEEETYLDNVRGALALERTDRGDRGRGGRSVRQSVLAGHRRTWASCLQTTVHMKERSAMEVFALNAAEYNTTGDRRVGERTFVVISSVTGTTEEMCAAVEKLHAAGARVLGFIDKEDSPGPGGGLVHQLPHNEQLKFFMTADRFMFLRGEFKDYDRYYAQLDACLPEGLAAAEKAADEFGRSFAKAHMNDKLHYFVGAGTLYGATYSYAMCYWEEMHWIRTKSIHAAEFFHGMLEIVDRDTPVTVFVGEDSQRELALRVAHFLPKVCGNFCVIDTADYPLEGIDPEYRGSLSHLLMHAVTNRIDAHLEALSGHDMKLRRYYRQMEY